MTPANRTLLPDIVETSSAALADWIVERHAEIQPDLPLRYGRDGSWRRSWRDDTRSRLAVLAEAVEFDSPVQFGAEIAWARCAFDARGLPADDLKHNLRAMREVLEFRLPPPLRHPVTACLSDASDQLARPHEHPPSLLDPTSPYSSGALAEVFRDYVIAVLEGRRADSFAVIHAAVGAGASITNIYNLVFAPTLTEIGRLWQLGELGVAEEHMATATTLENMARLRAVIELAPRDGRRAIAATVSGDLHEVGLRMVSDELELDGWTCRFLGASVPCDEILDMIEQWKPDLVAVSARLAVHLRTLRSFIAKVRAHPQFASTPVIVGGQPFTLDRELWGRVGADGFAVTSSQAAKVAGRLVPKPATPSRGPGTPPNGH